MNDATTLIVVIDTQIFLRAAINPRSLPAKLIFDFADHYLMAISPEIRVEIAEVLNRSSLRKKFPTLTDERTQQILEVLDSGQQLSLSIIASISRDPKDNIFLATALEAHADYLVSEDRDLLDIGTYENTRIINALEFLEILQTKSKPSTESDL